MTEKALEIYNEGSVCKSLQELFNPIALFTKWILLKIQLLKIIIIIIINPPIVDTHFPELSKLDLL